MIDGLAAIHPHHLGFLMLRGISITSPYGQAKHCAINVFDTNYSMSANEVMAKIFHLAQNMDEELPNSNLTTPASPTSPIFSCRCKSWLPQQLWRTRRSWHAQQVQYML
jgi:hypothetical protein